MSVTPDMLVTSNIKGKIEFTASCHAAKWQIVHTSTFLHSWHTCTHTKSYQQIQTLSGIKYEKNTNSHHLVNIIKSAATKWLFSVTLEHFKF